MLFLTSGFSKSSFWNHVHAKLKKKARASINFFPYTCNHLSLQALTRLYNVQQLTLCCLFTIFCSKYQLITEFTNGRCIVLVSLTYKHYLWDGLEIYISFLGSLCKILKLKAAFRLWENWFVFAALWNSLPHFYRHKPHTTKSNKSHNVCVM